MRASKTSHLRSLALVFASLAIGLACLCGPTTLIPSSPPAPAPATPTIPAPQNVSGLDPSGPWLIMSSSSGLWATNPDGSGLTQVTREEFWQGDLLRAVQPGGNLVAVLASQGDRYHGLTLNIISLSDGRVQKSIPLTTPSTEPGVNAMPGEVSVEAVRAIADTVSLAWSPDGTKLAFIGVLDGPTAELYLYTIATDTIQRVSTDDAQDFWPSWSPDGKYILYFGADGFGTGAGYSMRGVWSAYGDGTNVTWLYETDSSGEELIGWRDNETAILDTWNMVCGPGNLRLYNVVNGRETILQQDCFTSAAAGSWGAVTGAVLFSTESGTYLLSSESQEVTKIDDRPAQWIRFNSAGYMFAMTFPDGAMTTLAPDGTTRQDAPATAQDVAMFGLIWTWTNASGEMPGVWISGPGIDLGQIFTGSAYAPLWNTSDNTLYFLSASELGAQLYRATFSAYYGDSTMVAQLPDGVTEMAWVGTK